MLSCYASRVPTGSGLHGRLLDCGAQPRNRQLAPLFGWANQQSQAFDEQTLAKKPVFQHCSQTSREAVT